MRHVIRAAIGLLGVAMASASQSADIALPKDGWATWQVEAVEGAPAWCCWGSWDGHGAAPKTCQLDDDRDGYGSRDHATTDSIRVYAHLTDGKVERLRAFSASCPVEAKTPIRDLGNVAADDSVRLLMSLNKDGADALKGGDHRNDLLAAIAVHRGDAAQGALVSIARGNGSVETRKNAVFWLAMVRGAAGAEVVMPMMFDDANSELRQHAAFAVAQGKTPKAIEALIRQGNADKDAEVRAQAWFWLAQTEAPQAEKAIGEAVRRDGDDHVREQAVFALSQLPGERATRALIAAAEDRELGHEQRKRAVFWLAQSKSEGAGKYLEKVLAGEAAR